MMNADKARANVEKYLEKIEDAKTKRVAEYLEETVDRLVEQASNNGRSEILIDKMPVYGDNGLLAEELTRLGFKVWDRSVKFRIEW